jgi:radical SAM protein with 4Fe4S-binding SPASM domain
MAAASQYARVVGEATRTAVPLEVILELTESCNFRCTHCYLPSHSATDVLPTERLLQLLEELAQMGTLFLTFTGGEPLLRPDWLQLLQRARELGFAVTLLTNGSRLDEAAAAHLARLSVSVEVSYYSREAAVFDAITGVTGSFAAVTRGVERLRRHGVRVTLKVPLFAANAAALPAIRSWADALGADCLAYPTVFPRRNGDLAPLRGALDGAALADCLVRFPELQPPLSEPPADRDQWPLCAAGTRSATVAANGDVLACPLLPDAAGSLLASSFRRVWERAPLFTRLRALRWRDLETCRDCHRMAYCGRCPAQVLLEEGSDLGPSRSACTFAAAVETARERSR